MGLSIQERKARFMEEFAVSTAGGGEAAGCKVGNNGFQGSADASGPTAGFDPLLSRTLKRLKKDKKVEEGYVPLPVDKMNSKIKDKEEKATSTFKRFKLYTNGKSSNTGMAQKRVYKRELEKNASKIKNIKSKLRTHDPIESRFKELENKDK